MRTFLKENSRFKSRRFREFGVDFVHCNFAKLFHAQTAKSHTKERLKCKKHNRPSLKYLRLYKKENNCLN